MILAGQKGGLLQARTHRRADGCVVRATAATEPGPTPPQPVQQADIAAPNASQRYDIGQQTSPQPRKQRTGHEKSSSRRQSSPPPGDPARKSNTQQLTRAGTGRGTSQHGRTPNRRGVSKPRRAEAHRTVTAHSRPGYMDLVSEVLDICSDPKAAAGLHGQQQLSLLTEEHQTAYNAVRAVAYAQIFLPASGHSQPGSQSSSSAGVLAFTVQPHQQSSPPQRASGSTSSSTGGQAVSTTQTTLGPEAQQQQGERQQGQQQAAPPATSVLGTADGDRQEAGNASHQGSRPDISSAPGTQRSFLWGQKAQLELRVSFTSGLSVQQVSALGTTIPASPYIGPENLVYVSGKARVSDVAAMVQLGLHTMDYICLLAPGALSVLTALKGLMQAEDWLSRSVAAPQGSGGRVLAVVPELRVDNMPGAPSYAQWLPIRREARRAVTNESNRAPTGCYALHVMWARDNKGRLELQVPSALPPPGTWPLPAPPSTWSSSASSSSSSPSSSSAAAASASSAAAAAADNGSVTPGIRGSRYWPRAEDMVLKPKALQQLMQAQGSNADRLGLTGPEQHEEDARPNRLASFQRQQSSGTASGQASKRRADASQPVQSPGDQELTNTGEEEAVVVVEHAVAGSGGRQSSSSTKEKQQRQQLRLVVSADDEAKDGSFCDKILKHLDRKSQQGVPPEVVLLAQDDLDLARALKVAHQAARRIRLLRPSVAASQVEQEQQVVALKPRLYPDDSDSDHFSAFPVYAGVALHLAFMPHSSALSYLEATGPAGVPESGPDGNILDTADWLQQGPQQPALGWPSGEAEESAASSDTWPYAQPSFPPDSAAISASVPSPRPLPASGATVPRPSGAAGQLGAAPFNPAPGFPLLEPAPLPVAVPTPGMDEDGDDNNSDDNDVGDKAYNEAASSSGTNRQVQGASSNNDMILSAGPAPQPGDKQDDATEEDAADGQEQEDEEEEGDESPWEPATAGLSRGARAGLAAALLEGLGGERIAWAQAGKSPLERALVMRAAALANDTLAIKRQVEAVGLLASTKGPAEHLLLCFMLASSWDPCRLADPLLPIPGSEQEVQGAALPEEEEQGEGEQEQG